MIALATMCAKLHEHRFLILLRTSGAAFSGYGYLIWTDNQYSTRDSFWANGYGGQRIGWNRSNNRIMVVFSNEQSHVVDLYRLYADWAALR